MPTVQPTRFVVAPRRVWPGVVLGAVVLAAGLYLVLATRDVREGWVTVGFGAFLAVWFGHPWWRRVPMVWFDAAGLQARLPGFGRVRWQDLEAVRLAVVGRRSFLVVERTATARFAAPPRPLLRLLAQMAKSRDLAVPIDGLDLPPAKIVAAIALACELAVQQPPATG